MARWHTNERRSKQWELGKCRTSANLCRVSESRMAVVGSVALWGCSDCRSVVVVAELHSNPSWDAATEHTLLGCHVLNE